MKQFVRDTLILMSFHLSMHIDMDETNAANIQTGTAGILVGVQDRR